MSGGTKKETTQQNTTQTVQLPQWLTDSGQQLYGQAKSFSDANPVQAYTGQLTPAMSGNQTAASGLAAASQGTGQRDLSMARRYALAGATGQVAPVTSQDFDSAAAAKYMSPYLQQVQGNTLAEMRRQNQITDQQLGDSLQGAGAYGGTRQAVLQAEKEKGDNRNMLDYLAQSNQDAYNQAAQQFGADRAASMAAQTTNAQNQQSVLDRLLQAGNLENTLGTTASTLNSNDISNLSRTGAVEQATQGDADSAAYQEFLRNQSAPLDRYTTLMSLLTGTPKNVTTTGNASGTSTTTQSGGLLNALLGGGQLALAAFSERALKRDISRVGQLRDGTPIYSYRYIWDGVEDPKHVGVMADDVAEKQPWALGPRIGGFRTVNYPMLEAA